MQPNARQQPDRCTASVVDSRDRLCRALASRKWLLREPGSPVQHVQTTTPTASGRPASFWCVRDDLLHPLWGGNKARKLDAVVPSWVEGGTTDVVTCGGVQSAHTAAVAAAAANHGMRSHLLVRGEAPACPTGYHLIARMFGHVTYVSRADYVDRVALLERHAAAVEEQGRQEGRKVSVLQEGAGDALALLGLIRLVAWLAGVPIPAAASLGAELGAVPATSPGQLGVSEHSVYEPGAPVPGLPGTAAGAARWGDSTLAGATTLASRAVQLCVDSGTGTTATGLALGVALLSLPWTVHGIMLAGDLDYYRQQQQRLSAELARTCAAEDGWHESVTVAVAARAAQWDRLPVCWVPRSIPRRFGKVLPGDIEECTSIARQHGIPLDPIYTLAAWQHATQLSAAVHHPPSTRDSRQEGDDGSGGASGCTGTVGVDCELGHGGPSCGSSGLETGGAEPLVVMLHSGGMLGLHGLAQRFPERF